MEENCPQAVCDEIFMQAARRGGISAGGWLTLGEARMPEAGAGTAGAQAVVNPVRTRADWDAMRAAALADPGAFHGAIAARDMHWFVGDIGPYGAWLDKGEDGS